LGLAQIAGVVDIMGKELPANSLSRGVMGEVQREILHIQAMLSPGGVAQTTSQTLDDFPTRQISGRNRQKENASTSVQECFVLTPFIGITLNGN
jgi:hypothetical protein